jgi:cell division protein ZapA (FtsZ GTPase activity inhibitor)
MAGYDAAINIVYEQCKSMTSANKIKKYLKSKFDESENRVENMTNKTDKGGLFYYETL